MDYESEEIFKKELLDCILPAILATLYQQGKVTENMDMNTLRKKISENVNEKFIGSLTTAVIISDQFKNAIIDEFQLGRCEVATSLTGVYIEQITNEFYQSILQNKHGFSLKNYNDCMKSITIEGKLTWLFQLSTSSEVDYGLIAKVKKIYSIRNKIVHYKPKTETFDDWNNNDSDVDRPDLDANELIHVLEELKSIYDKTLEKVFPSIGIGKELYKKLD
ncbi:MAG: hypothetical protein VB078_04505 [Clostridiaceae bacterium]|nr:hypothetical protein [Clostridiaceae bacterium]